VKDGDIRPSQALELTTPLNLTPLIKASSFDLVDAISMQQIHDGYTQTKYNEDGTSYEEHIPGLNNPFYETSTLTPYYRDYWSAIDSEGNVFITAIPYLNVTNTLSIKGTNISSLFAAKSVESNFYEFTEYAENTYAVKTVENLLLEDVGDDMILISQAGENPVWMNPGDIFDFVPISHATSSTTYGLGTTSKYGHVKISNGDVNTVASANGLVAGMDHSHGNYALTTKLPKFSLSGTVLTITDNS
jgi:hypothetical protein